MTVGEKYTGRAERDGADTLGYLWLLLVFLYFLLFAPRLLKYFCFCIPLIMSSCAVDGCKTRSGRNNKLSLFKLPKEQATRQTWISFCARDIDLQFEHAAICEKHFEEKYFRNTNLMKRSFGIPCRISSKMELFQRCRRRAWGKITCI